ncbi:carbohydrate binding family 9 domain-containing protein [Hymenobacter sp. BT635]|uniref:Carbohydrate binding family 9 domain-containing protein n=1 Tax=Hymenobacter nitidus TaxID=2880929 RepID=A0ABS8AC35_9BACT|nr:DUF5916 domain-containing protein [Hymenobacter nitidus]MCB2377983.1 carbohydrate binding family 9 domain-containing protein [Hymenobacter nitidus]
MTLPSTLRLLLFLLGCLLGLILPAQAQSTAPIAAAAATAAPKRQLQAVRITEVIKLDGVLDETVWQQAPVATDFVQQRPNPGVPERHKTEVRVLYDDNNLYIGAAMHDVSPDSILREMTARDQFGNSDLFCIFLDTYHDQLNGYNFGVTPAGVQYDARYSPAGGEDFNWNAVWDARTTIRGTDWYAEMRIPYSAIRFSKQAEQLWGLNFARQRKRDNAQYFWNEVKPAVNGFVNQWGDLRGIRDVQPPLRLSLTPYVSSYVNHNPLSAEGTRRTTTSFNGGADIKWGINESFTLDATLVPDFGQVQSDNQVLNLSPFEVQFAENRQFFTEGTELFSKGNLFYSRRVGATPIGFYEVKAGQGEKLVRNPSETQLLNATKVSGRTKSGLGIGLFNAVSNDMYATVRNDETGQERQIATQPLSNYSIAVLDQSLKNNSYVSLINTNVTRFGRTYDANVTGGLFRFNDKHNAYSIDGSLVYSRRRGTVFGKDEQVSDQDGFKYAVGLGKISGNLTWGLNHTIESDRYNPNDLGILFGNNKISQAADVAYRIYKPFWKVNNMAFFGQVGQALLYKPTRYQSLYFYNGFNTTFTKSFLQIGYDLSYNAKTHDFFEPRTSPLGEYFVRVPAYTDFVAFLNSDTRKRFSYGLNAGIQHFAQDARLDRPRRMRYSFGAYPRYRVNNHLTFRYSLDWSRSNNQVGYVNGGLDEAQPLDRPFLGQVLLGRRAVSTVANVVSVAYTFTNRMSLTLRTRHYTSNVRYFDFVTLAPGGQETPADYRRTRDNTYNAFNVDAVYAWWFAPGSQISVVWKNANSPDIQANEFTPLYFSNLSNTINTPHNNSVSVKILYYLDYLAFRKRRG